MQADHESASGATGGTAGRLASLARATISANGSLFSNASAMVVGTLFSAGLGFVYWWLAARTLPAETVGIGAAAISIMGLCALMGEWGLGTLLVGEIPRRGGKAPGLVLAALIAAFGLSAVCGLVTVVLASWLAPAANATWGTPHLLALFIAGAAINGVTLTLDQAFVGMLRGALQMYRNAAFATIKLALLALAAWLTASGGPDAILASWVVGMLASVVVVLCLRGSQRWPLWSQPPDWPGLRGCARSTFDHHVLNLMTQAPGLILPFLVVVVLSAKANAAFYAAWMLVGVGLLVPASLATVLFTVGRTEPARLAQRMRVSLKISLATGIAVGCGFYLLSDFLLGLFNPEYPAIAGNGIGLLGFTVAGFAVKYHYIAAKRLEDDMLRGSLMLGLGGALEVAAAVAGAMLGGLSGLTLGLLAAVLLQAVCMLPSLLRLGWPRLTTDIGSDIAPASNAAPENGIPGRHP